MNSSATLIIALLFSFFAVQAPAAEPATQDPAQTVQAFYAYHLKHDMGFGKTQINARKSWLTPDLYALITKVLKKPVPEGDAPDIEGDIFTDSQDTPTAFHVGKATTDKTTAKVEVTFTWSKEKRKYTVILSQIDHAWRIQDIDYGDRSMTKDLNQAIH